MQVEHEARLRNYLLEKKKQLNYADGGATQSGHLRHRSRRHQSPHQCQARRGAIEIYALFSV